jgi:hypothetical protein
MTPTNTIALATLTATLTLVAGCTRSDDGGTTTTTTTTPPPATAPAMTNDGHAHDSVSIGTATVGDLTVELGQGHGKVDAGQMEHLTVKLPYSDDGATIVRAWLGTEDRTMSMVGKADYAPSHDDYDVHALAPDPLPSNVMWWIEIEKPDGEKLLGSAKPLM